MDINNLFKRYNSYIVSKCEHNSLKGLVNLVLENPEDGKQHIVNFHNVTFFNVMIDLDAQKLHEQEDLPRVFMEISKVDENLGVTKHKQDWFKNYDFSYNYVLVCSESIMMIKCSYVELDGMDVEEYPEEEVIVESSRIFYSDDDLDEMERNGQWPETISYLKQKFEENPTRKDVVYRFAMQSWYILKFKDVCGMDDKDQRTELKNNLRDLRVHAKQEFEDDVNYKWIFGHMMEENPFAFVAVITYTDEVKINGRKMITEAAADDPENLLAQVAFLSNDKKMLYKKKKKQLKPLLTEYFPSTSVVDKYFENYFGN